jgi:serine protease
MQSGTIARVKSRAPLPALLLLALPPCLHAADEVGVDRIIVQWRAEPHATDAARRQRGRELSDRLGNPFAGRRNLGGGMSLLQLARAQRGTELAATLAALRADPAVEVAEVDHRVRALAYTPDDPLFSSAYPYLGGQYGYQWYLKGGHPSSIRMDLAWDITRGGATPPTSPVVIAVIDSGVRPSHPDLAGKLLPGFDFVSSRPAGNDGDGWDPDPTDPGDYITAEDLAIAPFKDETCGGGTNHDEPVNSTWHGTRVSGLIGAGTDNGTGIAGAGFNLRILPVRALGKCGGYESDVLAAMYWAAGFFDTDSGLPIPAPLLADEQALRDHRNLYPAQVINMSLGSAVPCDEIYARAVREITSIGVLIVAAAGNGGGEVNQPANCPGVLAVAGLRHAGTKVGYSSLGPEVGIAAPAGNCSVSAGPCLYALTTTSNLGLKEPAADDYSTPVVQPSFGTSFSSPLVAATAGLMKAVNPALTPALLTARIKAAARPFPTTDELVPATTQACTVPATPPEDPQPCVCTTAVCGAGMLDAGQSVALALQPAVLVKASRSSRTYVLDGSASAAATGRSILGREWLVVSTSGGAQVPVITNATEDIASVPVPELGTVVVQLAITDDQGATGTTRVTLTPVAATSDAAPARDTIHRGGGGRTNAALLAMLAMLLVAVAFRRRAHPPRFH